MKAFIVSLLLFLSVLSYSQDGTLDPSFGNNGVVQTDFYGFDDYMWDIELQSDGKILAAGSAQTNSGSFDKVVIRYNADGSRDTGFASTGTLLVGTMGAIYIKVLPDDTFLAIRSSAQGDGDIFISKYSQDGVLDTSYGVNGFAVFNYFEIDIALSMVFPNDGSMIVAARSAGQGEYYMTLFKVLPDGNLDTSFGDSGFTAVDIGDYFGQLTIQIQNENSIIAALDYDISGTETAIDVYRFTLDGELDSSFGDGGVVTKTYQTTFLHCKMAVDNNGKIVLISTEWDDAPEPVHTTTMFRYNVNGATDNSFAQGGSYVFGYGFFTDRINIQPNNRILVSGGIPGFESTLFTMRRFYNNGNPDPSFSFQGHYEFEGVDIELTPDERIITAGFSYWYDGDVDYVLAALNNSPLGLNEFSSNSISVYPNPTSGVININQDFDSLENLQLFNVQGQLLMEIPLADQQNTVDLSHLESGVYFLNSGQTTVKILKQ